MNRIVANMKKRKSEFSDNTEVSEVLHHTLNFSSTALQVDLTKCVECTRCVRVCTEVQGIGVWKYHEGAAFPITTIANKPITETMCISCGQVYSS